MKKVLSWALGLSPYSLTAFGVLGLAWGAFVTTLFGVFSRPLGTFLFALLLLSFLFSLLLLFRERSWVSVGILLSLVLLGSLITWSSAPTVFSGRDQGAIAEAAWRLAENGELVFSTPATTAFFDLYGQGTALNFPGFAYTESGSLITQFPLAYTAWLAVFVALFELSGYALANMALLVFFGWSLYELLRDFVSPRFALVGSVLAVTNFLTLWITKYTLTENLAAPIFILMVLSLLRVLQSPSVTGYALLLFSTALFPFIRVEGFVFALIVFLLLALSRPARSFLLASSALRLVIPALLFGFLFLRDFFINLPYYTVIGKALIKKWHTFSTVGSFTLDDAPLHLGSLFLAYGLLPLFLFSFFAVLWILREKRFVLLPALFLVAPTALYFFLPFITPDHPWMLRRYFFSLLPMAVFLIVVAVSSINEHLESRHRVLIPTFFILLFLAQGSGFIRAITHIDNPTLLAQTKVFAERFGPRDLILIDRAASGDPFSLLSGPLNFLFGKQAVYFFNPTDLDNLDRSAFDRVYLLVPEDGLDRAYTFFGERLIPLKTESFVTKSLDTSLPNPFTPPLPKTTIAHSVLFEVK